MDCMAGESAKLESGVSERSLRGALLAIVRVEVRWSVEVGRKEWFGESNWGQDFIGRLPEKLGRS